MTNRPFTSRTCAVIDARGKVTIPIPMRPAETGHVSRCGARTRSGAPCKSAPVSGRRRCRMHGGADGSGAPKGPKNGNYKHGCYTEEVQATRRWLRDATKRLRDLR
jgi:hypothetical protein